MRLVCTTVAYFLSISAHIYMVMGYVHNNGILAGLIAQNVRIMCHHCVPLSHSDPSGLNPDLIQLAFFFAFFLLG